MSKGYVFGCSHTYGHGLEDCYDKDTGWPSTVPSKLAWPHLLQVMGLYKEYTNFSQVGDSSDDVLKKLLESDVTKNDICIILWPTYTRRSVYVDNDLKTFRVQDKEATHFYKNTHINELKYNFYKNILLANLYTDVYNIFVDLEDLDMQPLLCPILSNFSHKFSNINFQDILNNHPKALDGVHAGINAHIHLANQINTFINN